MCRVLLRSFSERSDSRAPASITERPFTAIIGSEHARTNENAVCTSDIFVRNIISICMTSVMIAVARQ